jgi:uncharacterized membrane protein
VTALRGPATSAAPASFDRESLEFGRVVNLSDAVFAFAMTLLVLGIELPEQTTGPLAGQLPRVLPSLGAFALSFALVAATWWQHHRFVARLQRVDGRLVALDLVFLGVVALVPFPTGVVGRHPTDPAAVVTFAAAFVTLTLLAVAMVAYAQRAGAWTHPLPEPLYPWVVAGYLVVTGIMIVAAVVALRWPLVGLAILACSGVGEVVLRYRAPDGYRDWS